MIVGIGTDIVSVARIRGVWERRGERFSRHLLSSRELTEFAQVNAPEYFLAKRFVAKEAAAKAFGTGFSGGLTPRDIGITHNDRGAPLLHYTATAKVLSERMGVTRSWLSISDEKEYAVAMVVLEGYVV